MNDNKLLIFDVDFFVIREEEYREHTMKANCEVYSKLEQTIQK